MSLERFILADNLSYFRNKLPELAPEDRRTVELIATAVARELALFDAQRTGAAGEDAALPAGASDQDRAEAIARFQGGDGAAPWPPALVDPRPGLVLAEVNAPFLEAAALPRDAVVGKPFFTLFPDNPADPRATGMAALYESLRRVADGAPEDVMALQRYDVRDADGVWCERYWLPVNTAVTDDAGRLLYILHTSREQPAPTA